MGIASSNYSEAAYPIFTPGSGYLYNDGGELLIGSATDDVVLFAGGVDTTDEALRINKTTKALTAGGALNIGGALDITGAAVFGSTVLLDANPTTALQAATKQYVDNQVTAGLHIHEPVRVETTGNLTATYAQGGTTFNITTITSTTTVTTSVNHGLVVNDQIWLTTTAGNGLSVNVAYFVFSVPAVNQLTLSLTFDGTQITGLTNAAGLTYATRANSGVGATLTNSGAQAALVVDGITLSTTNRVMVRLQTAGAENGVYTVTSVGSGSTNWVLTRATDNNQVNPANPNGLGTGDYFFTQEGTLNAGDSHVLTTEPNTMIIGYTTLTYTQFSGSVDYTGGTNINITGQVISLTGTVAATNGGTGTSTVTTGDLLYGSAANTWSKLPAGAGYKSLTMNAGGTQVEWNAVALNQSGAVSGALGPTNGGTGQSAYALGDILYSDATNSVARLAGNTTTTKKFLGQTGNASVSAAPSWQQPAASDITGLATSATTDTTNAANITSGTLPTARISGSYTGITGVGTLAAGTWNGSAIGAAYGGTGQTVYAVGDLVYADTTTTLAKLADIAVGNALISGGVSAAPSWGKIGLTTHVSGTLPVGSGGTGVTTSTGTGSVVLSTSPTFSTSVVLPSTFSTNQFINGTGDSATFASYNFALSGWNGMAFYNPTSGGAYQNQVSGVVDFRNGIINMKGGFQVNGTTVVYNSGTWNINVTGSAGSATNATFASSATNATFASSATNASAATNAGGITTTQPNLGYSISGQNIDYGSQGGPQVQSQGGGAAMMSFHRPGAYAINFGLGTDNQLRTGGWSRGGNHVILDSGNYTSYAPTTTGGGASGTWGINVTGSAASASNAGFASSATNATFASSAGSATNAAYATYAGLSGGVNSAYNTVGSYMFAVSVNQVNLDPNNTIVGAALYPGAVRGTGTWTSVSPVTTSSAANTALIGNFVGTLSGTWRIMGTMNQYSTSASRQGTLCLRIS
jgi:hypothetical protein